MPQPADPPPLGEALHRLLASAERAPGVPEEILDQLRELRAVAEESERALARERQRQVRRARLEAALPKIAESLDVREVFSSLSGIIGEVIPHDVLMFALLLPDRTGVQVQASTRQGIVELPPYRFSNPDESLEANWDFLLGYDLEVLDAETARVRISSRDAVSREEVVLRLGPQWIAFVRQAEVRSTMRVPIRDQGSPIGGVAFLSRAPDAYDEEDGHAAARVAEHLALALAHQRLAEEQRLRDRFTALDAALPQLDNVRELDEIADAVERITRALVPHDAVGVMVKHAGGGSVSGIAGGATRMAAEATPEFMEQQIERIRPEGYMRILDLEILDEKKRIVRQHIASGEGRIQRDVEAPEQTFQALKAMGTRSEVWSAVHEGEEIVGVLLLASRTPSAFTDGDVAVARRIAERISLRLAQERIEGATRSAREASARARELETRVESLQRELERFSAHRAIGQSAAWKKALADATQVAGTEATVLITGESGTGKEVIARYIHRGSQRAKGPFVALNCAALPEQLLESELFGHERGAFTGAIESRAGKIEQAAGGVLFLDEVGEMSPSVQAKFLRVLQEREFQRIGGSKTIKADVRIVAATNRDPRAAIASGQFREDLYYRLGVFEIHLPPLRERPEDVLVLAQAFLEEVGNSIGRPAAGISDDARELLLAHPWPGNVRELRNALERAVILCQGGLVAREHLPIALARAERGALRISTPASGPTSFPTDGLSLEQVERRMLQGAMEQSRGNKVQAAKLLGLTRGQLYSLLRRHGLTDARR